MRNILKALLFAALLAPPAYAAENLKQNSDGSTVWSNSNSEEIGVGPSALIVTTASPTSTAATSYIVSPMRGIIREVLSIVDAGPSVVTAAETVTVLVAKAVSQLGSDGTNPQANFKQLSGWTTVNMTIAAGSSQGQVDKMGLATYASPTSLVNNTVEQYGVIAIHATGGGSNVYRFVIRIDPY
jgi:hypothetical protein